MKWEEIRKYYPERWILLEAIKAHSEQDMRIVEQLAVVGVYDDSNTAMKSYSQLHHEAPERELYVFHTSREALDITERHWQGIRALRIEVGALDYGMNISGILGTDFLVAVGAVIDLARLDVHQGVP